MRYNKEIRMSEKAPMYIYATETVRNYYSLLDIRGKKVLTICGSGDQVLNALYLGASYVTGFDLNYNSLHMLNLKVGAIKSLNYKEFLRFFGKRQASGSFNYDLYLKIKVNLNKETANFFDELFKQFDRKGLKLIKSNYFRQRTDFVSRSIKRINIYLAKERDYLKMKNIVSKKKIKFIQSDVIKISSKIKLKSEKFDIINLSNVPNYLRSVISQTEPVEYLYNKVLIPMRRILRPHGKIFFVSYSNRIYPNRIALATPPISTKESFNKLKQKPYFKVSKIEFAGITPTTKDRITILEMK